MPSYVFTGLTAGRTASVFMEGGGANPRTSVASGTVAADGSLTLTLDLGSYRAEDGRSVAYAAQTDDSTTQQADLAAGSAAAGVSGHFRPEDQAGADDAAKFTAAVTAMRNLATFGKKGAVVLQPREYVLTGLTTTLAEGDTFIGVPGVPRREFSNGTILKSTSGDMFALSGNTKDVTFFGITFVGKTSGSAGAPNWLTPVTDLGAGAILQYSLIEKCGFKSFSKVFYGRMLGCTVQDTYTNNCYDDLWTIAGSDNFLSQNFYNHSGFATSATKVALHLTSCSKTTVVGDFPTGYGCTPIRVTGGKSNLFLHVKSDAQGDGVTAKSSPGAGVVVNGGKGHTFVGLNVFNNMTAPATALGGTAQNAGEVTVLGGAEVTFIGTVFDHGNGTTEISLTPASTPTFAVSGSSKVTLIGTRHVNGAVPIVTVDATSVVSRSYAPVRMSKAASESVASSTTVQDDDHLFFAVDANRTVEVDGVLFVDGVDTADIKLAMSAPADATVLINFDGLATGPTGSGSVNRFLTGNFTADAAQVAAVGIGTAGTRVAVNVRGIVTTSATAGTIRLRWAQNASSATPTTLLAGSYLRFTDVA